MATNIIERVRRLIREQAGIALNAVPAVEKAVTQKRADCWEGQTASQPNVRP